MQCWWETHPSAETFTWNLQTIGAAPLIFAESPSSRAHLMKTKAFIQRGRIAFLPPSFLWLIRTHWGFSGHRKLPSAVCLEVGSTPAFMAPSSPLTSWYTSPSRLSHRSQNPSPWKIWLSQYKGNGHGFRACILKYKESLRGLSGWPLLWFVFTSQPGLLIPQLSACICNKLCCALGFFYPFLRHRWMLLFCPIFLWAALLKIPKDSTVILWKKKVFLGLASE